jgi:dihydrofolate reductase
MGKVVVIEHLTLDGVMQAPGHPDEDSRGGFVHGGWASRGSRIREPAIQEAMGARMGPDWSLLLGRTTYQQFADYWPKQAPNRFTEALTNVRKYVASTTLTEPLPWANSTLLPGDAADPIASLKQRQQGNLVIFGSGVLVQALTRRDLVDEYLLHIHPVVLGSGRRLFPDTTPPATLRLIDYATTTSGVVSVTYQPEPRS